MKYWTLLAALASGLFLASRPKCTHGCKTVAEHLINYGIDGLIG